MRAGMKNASVREAGRIRRHERIRRRLAGTSDRPRLVVHRSHLHMDAQLVDDRVGKTLMTCSTRQKDLKKSLKCCGNVEAAKRLGEKVAVAAVAAGIRKVVFDRGGYLYHGRVKALADAARAKGLEL